MRDCLLCQDEGYVQVRYCDLAEGRVWKALHLKRLEQGREWLRGAEAMERADKEKFIEAPKKRTFETMARESRVLERGYPGTNFALPCECLPRRRDQAKRQAVRVFNHLPDGVAQMTFASWQPRPGTEEAHEAAVAFASGATEYTCLVLTGNYGSGKTHLLSAIIGQLTERLLPARYRFVPELLSELRASQFDEDEKGKLDSLLASYSAVGMLGLDDMGAGKSQPSAWAIEQMEIIINHRYERGLPMVVTTNLSVKAMAARWGERIAERLFDFRSGKVHVVTLDAPSYRTNMTWK